MKYTPPKVPPPADRVGRSIRYRGMKDLERQEATWKRDGFRHHTSDDPWAEDFRPCEPGCPEHTQGSAA